MATWRWGKKWSQRAQELSADSYALYLAVRDPRVPLYAKLLAGAIVVYAVSPIDLIPDFIPVLGMLDDLVIVPLGIAIVLKMIPREVMDELRQMARGRLSQGMPRRWIGALIIICIWALFLWLVGSLIVKGLSG